MGTFETQCSCEIWHIARQQFVGKPHFRGRPITPFWDQSGFPLLFPLPFPNFFLPSRLFSYPAFALTTWNWPLSPAWTSGIAMSFPAGVQHRRAPATKAFLVYIKSKKWAWWQLFWFFLWQPKCSCKLKGATVQTMLC